MRYTGPKNKISRREGTDLGLKTTGSKAQASVLKKINVKPGQHGLRYRRKSSEHSRQLREKQKLRFTYGVSESQMKRYFDEASRQKGNTAVFLAEKLERRLDNMVYRFGFAPTRAAARQLVCHGHITVKGKVLDIPSYFVREGEAITFGKDSSKKIPYIEIFREQNDVKPPEWIELKKDTGSLKGTPDTSIIEQQVNMRLVIEFYSR